ncbi:hypothetical protein [Agrobacterium sp. ICMP 6402]|uniref:hypothetical protein n=1 Tax=Agrobacterium sp. ICMP 6402 TaxID=2292443 RepID=UPI001296C989|nr:hypothetical protein [Agrobacterium sp. ICMP 6402]
MQAAQLAATLLVGGSAATIAWRQWRTAKDKVKLDLFDRRFAVFMDVRKLVSEAGQQRNFSDRALPNEVIARGRFLFGKDVQDQLMELHSMCTLVDMDDPHVRSKIDPWFQSFIKTLQPYMSLGGLKS